MGGRDARWFQEKRPMKHGMQTGVENGSHQTNPPQTEQEKIKILNFVDSLLPRSMKPINDQYEGIDYKFFDTTFDRKFGWGEKGKNTIRIRILDGKLINSSDYTMVIHSDRIEFFPTQKIHDYVIKNPNKVEANRGINPRRAKKSGQILYFHSVISLEDLYKQGKIAPVTITIPIEQIAQHKVKLKLRQKAKLLETVERALSRVYMQRAARNSKNGDRGTRNFFKEIFSKKKRQQPIRNLKANGTVKKMFIPRNGRRWA